MGAVARWRALPASLRAARRTTRALRDRGAARRGWGSGHGRSGVTDLHGLATRALRTLDPEDAHGWAIRGLKMGLGPVRGRHDPILAGSLAGLPLPNVVGLAPGFDKDAEVFGPMLRAGFGFVECGTVTPKPQAGNPRPRLFRLTEDRAVINRMGFNNRGLEAFAGRLSRRGRGVVGAN